MATEAESGHNYLAGPEKGGLPRERDDRCYFNSEFAVSFLDHALKIVLADVDDADLTFGILFGITRMSGFLPRIIGSPSVSPGTNEGEGAVGRCTFRAHDRG